MSVIAFPQYKEIDKLIAKFHITELNLSDKELLHESITEIRKAHGVFEQNQFKAIVELLKHDWLPSDIPVILPAPSNMWWR